MRGLADDLPLMRWLNDHIWPAEAAHVSAKFVYDGTLLACAEMLRAGVTCFNDMYFFPDAAARAASDAQIRAVLGMIVIEFPSAYAGDADSYLHRGLETRDAFRDHPSIEILSRAARALHRFRQKFRESAHLFGTTQCADPYSCARN